MKQSHKILALALATTVVTSSVVTPIAPLASNIEVANVTVAFKDLKTTHWAIEYIQEGVQKGFIDGYSDNTFKPEQAVTNAQFIKMLATAINPTYDFKADKGENWYKPYVDVALKSGLVKEGDFSNYNAKMTRIDLAKLGVRGIGQDTTNNKEWFYIATSKGLMNGVDSKGTLKENGTMTRAQATAMISRVLQVREGKTLAVDKNAVANAKEIMNTVFTDIKKHWANETILSAVEKGYVSGYQDGTFRPDQKVSNAEFVKMLVSALYPNQSIEVVSGGKWYVPYLDVAISKNLVKANEFKDVNAKMTRNDLAKLGSRGIGETSNTDDKKWMFIATSNGLIHGIDKKGTLNEKGTMTRAQAVTMIERVIATNKGEKQTVDNLAVANAKIIWKGEEKDYSSAITLDVPFISLSSANAVKGSELASMLSALQYKGYAKDITLKEFLDKVPKSRNNPREGYSGSPYILDSNILQSIYSIPLSNYALKYSKTVEDLSGYFPNELVDELKQGNPVVVYVTKNFDSPIWKMYEWDNWGTSSTLSNVIGITLVGYNKATHEYQVLDSTATNEKSATYWVDGDTFEKAYYNLSYAIVVR